MNKDQIYILFSYELLKSDLSDSDFSAFLKENSIECDHTYSKRTTLDVKTFTDTLYAAFLSDIVYLKLLSVPDDYWLKPLSKKIEFWINHFNNDSDFIKIISDYLARLNKYETFEYLAGEINGTTGEEQIYISIPENNPQLMLGIVNKLRTTNRFLSPIFMIDKELIGGLKIQFKESLYDYSWQNQIKSKLL